MKIKALRPFDFFRLETSQSLLWVFFTILCGLLGIAMNVWSHLGPDMSLWDSVKMEFSVNSFYTYSIVLITCTIGSLIMKMDANKYLMFSRFKVWLMVVLLLLLICGTVFCVTPGKIKTNSVQFIYGLLSIFIAVYGFCVINLDRHPDEFSDLQEKISVDEAEQLQKLINQATEVKQDNKGNRV